MLFKQPVEEKHWDFTPSTQIISQILSGRMFPLTLDGIDNAMRELSMKK